MKYLVIWNSPQKSFHAFNMTILFISNIRNGLKWSEINVIIRDNLERKKAQGFEIEVNCWKGGFSDQNGQKLLSKFVGREGGLEDMEG